MEARARLHGSGRWARIAVDFRPARNADDRERNAMYADLVVGGRWRSLPNGGSWLYPLTTAKCREMRAAWGDMLRIRNDLAEWYTLVDEAERRQTRKGDQTDGRLRVVPEVAPKLFAALAADQRAGAAWIATAHDGAGLYAPEMGVGKTRAVIAGLVERQVTGNVMILCPKISVRSVWGKELKEWLPPDWGVHLARGTRKKREEAIAAWMADDRETSVLVVVAEMLRVKAKLKNGKIAKDEDGKTTLEGYEYPELYDADWDAVVIDESQKLLASLTVTKATLAGWGLRKLPMTSGGTSLRLAVTATPWGDGGEVHGVFGTLHWLWPREFSSFWRFAEENFIVQDKTIGRGKSVKVIGRLKDPDGMDGFYKSLGPRVFRRTLEEVSPAHKGLLRHHVLHCEMTPAQERQYVEMSENAELVTDGGVIVANGVLAELTRARQVANGVLNVREGHVFYTGESGKLDAVMEVLESMGHLRKGGGGRKLLIASQFNEYLDVMAARLRANQVPYHMMTGRSTDNQRDRMMAEFQASPLSGPRIFMLNAKAGGVSITLDMADYLLQLDEMFPPEANEQLHRRIFRRSRVHQAHVIYFRTEGTVDENVAGSVAAKLHQQLNAMDGRRGLAVVREHLRYRPAGDS